MAKKKDAPRVLDLSTKLATSLADPTSLPTPEPGIYENVPAETYHLWDAVSNSRLTLLDRSPAHLKAALLTPKPPTPALKLGTATHCAVLEPGVFVKRYTKAERCTAIKKGDGQRCTNMGLALDRKDGWRCGVHAAVEPTLGLDVLSDEHFAVCVGVQRSFSESPRISRAFNEGRVAKEVSIVWIDPETGLKCKARLDLLAFDLAGGTIVDLKSTIDARMRPFAVAIYKYGYHRQAAMYIPAAQSLDLAIEHYAIAAYEKAAPFAIAGYRVDQGALDAGEVEVRRLLRLYAECVNKNVWPTAPSYSPEWEDISIPSWAFEQVFTGEEMGA